MTEIKVVSIDMFRTLTDVDNVLRYERWKRLFKERYTFELAEECQALLDSSWNKRFPRDRFTLQKEVLLQCFKDVFEAFPCSFSPLEAAELTVHLHSLSYPFFDSIPFLNKVGDKYPICLCTDADEDVLGTWRHMHAFDHIFTSEQLRMYKGYADGKFFKLVIGHYQVKPEQILHIGDDSGEILGAYRSGMKTCWLNRKDKLWTDIVKPDYEVTSLIQAALILGVDIGQEKKVG